MQQVITTVGLDLAKNLFQVHGADAQGRPVLRRRLAREKVLEFFATLPPCLVGLEACAAAHYWARELAKLGHTVRLRWCPNLKIGRYSGHLSPLTGACRVGGLEPPRLPVGHDCRPYRVGCCVDRRHAQRPFDTSPTKW